MPDASWTVPAWQSRKPRGGPIGRAAAAQRKDDQAKGIKQQGRAKGAGFYAGPAFERVDGGGGDLLDGDTAVAAIAQLRKHAKDPSRPFFLAVGFANPPVARVAPKEYWERYDRVRLPLATNEFLPKGVSVYAKLRNSLSKRLREEFAVQEFKQPAAGK